MHQFLFNEISENRFIAFNEVIEINIDKLNMFWKRWTKLKP